MSAVSYQDFLRTKVVTAQDRGLVVSPDSLNPKLFAHQRALSAWAIRGGNRAINQYTMEGETVFDPFAGIGTVPLRALKLKRKGYGVELADGYFRDAMYYCSAAEREIESPTLFDLVAAAEGSK